MTTRCTKQPVRHAEESGLVGWKNHTVCHPALSITYWDTSTRQCLAEMFLWCREVAT